MQGNQLQIGDGLPSKETTVQKINIRTIAKKVFKKKFVRSISRDGYVSLIGIKGEMLPEELKKLEENGVMFDGVQPNWAGLRDMIWITLYTKMVIN